MPSEYTQDQLNEIELGKKEGLNTSIYENPAFLPMQMQQIRVGLSKGLDASVYADPGYDWFQMEELRKGLENGVDVKSFADKSIPHDLMHEYRHALRDGVDISDYKGNRRGVKSAAIIRQLRRGRRNGVELTPYIEQGFDAEQLEGIRVALEREIDIDPYLNKDYRGSALDEIRLGLEDMIDVDVYADVGYNWKQMHEIRLGLKHRVDVSMYSNKLYSSQQMREIRLGLQEGLDVEGYRLMRFSATDMKRKRLELLEMLENAKKIAESTIDKVEEIVHRKVSEEEGLETLTLSVSGDRMEAYVDILDEHLKYTEQELLKVTWEGEIRKGIIRDNMRKAETGEITDKHILVAKGELAEDGQDGYYEFFFRTDIDGKPKILEDGSVDYNNIEWFDNVNQGATVAIYHPATPGKDGFDVYGTVLPARKGHELPVLSGSGFTMTKDKLTYISNYDGFICLKDESKIMISEILEVDEVSIATGFIVYKGSVHVRGDVGVGGVINCGGDVVIDGFVEGGNISAEGDVILKRGMNGNGKGMIRAGKNVTAKFLESTNVFAGDTITVDYATNCELYAENSIEVKNRKGALVGGKANGLKGMIISNAGNRLGTKTRICTGIPQSMENEKKALLQKLTANREQLKVLKSAEDEFHAKYKLEILATMEVFTKIENAVYTKQLDVEAAEEELEKFKEKMKEYHNSKIVIKGDLFDGVDIEISGKHWISSGMRDVTLKLVNDEHGEHILAFHE